MAWLVVAALGAVAFAAVRYLPPFHPAQLWALPWLVVSSLYSLDLLPYNPLRAETAALIVTASAAFCLAAWLAGGRNAGQRKSLAAGVPEDSFTMARTAAGMLLLLTGLWLLTFLFQAAVTYGLRAALISSVDVRSGLQTGQFVLTIKFVYAGLAAAMASALAAALAPDQRTRRRWLLAAALPVFAMYFSTGRSNFVTALVMAVLVYAVARPVAPRIRLVALGFFAAAAVFVLTLTVGGNIIGKTFKASELATIGSAFTEHRVLEPFALPYQYATAPIAALNELVPSVGAFGATAGCATVPLACTLGQRVGVTGEPVPAIRVFTAKPLEWNTYTALDAPLLDAGPIMGILVVAALGILAGLAWGGARTGKPIIVALYGIVGTATISSVTQNNFFAFHYLGAILLFSLAWLIAARLRSRNSGQAPSHTKLASLPRSSSGSLPRRLGL